MRATIKYSGTLTVLAAHDSDAILKAMCNLPDGASVELIGREAEGTPARMPELRTIDTVLAPAPAPAAFPKGRWL